MLQNDQLINIFNKNYFVIFLIIEVIAFIITFKLVFIYVPPIDIFYIVFVSILFSALFCLVIYETGITILELNIKTIIIIFFLIYIVLTVWYYTLKAYPEYNSIVKFRKQRADLIYNIQKNTPPLESLLAYKRQLADLYLHADPAVDKFEPNVNLWGVSLMNVFLEEQIKKGNGIQYKEDMYDLAEISFKIANRDLAEGWYKMAFDFGVTKALNRYEERMKELSENSDN